MISFASSKTASQRWPAMYLPNSGIGRFDAMQNARSSSSKVESVKPWSTSSRMGSMSFRPGWSGNRASVSSRALRVKGLSEAVVDDAPEPGFVEVPGRVEDGAGGGRGADAEADREVVAGEAGGAVGADRSWSSVFEGYDIEGR
jgi:hypothetical protein